MSSVEECCVRKKREEGIVAELKGLRDTIILAFERLEGGERFFRQPWTHHGGGGGEMAILRGKVFEKAAVNWSGVRGEALPLGEGQGPFFATGVSVITHMCNPFMPTVHMNVRYIQTADSFWFGGGYDLTPMGFEQQEDTDHFHQMAQQAVGPRLYKMFAENAARYFYIKHWGKERGVGGIFFDHYNTGDFEKDRAMWSHVGATFLDTILPIYERRKKTPYTQRDKEVQNRLRAHYVEFNLLYDRGTRFGFLTGGRPEAILASLPPTATW